MSSSTVREKELFLAALELETDAERRAFVERECADDQPLQMAILELLAAHRHTANVLDGGSPLEHHFPIGLRHAMDAVDPTLHLARSDTRPRDDRSGETIGPYRLMEKLGEGGFGEVYVAEQKMPVRRKVALKLLKPGMDSRDVIARFEAERQALAMMEHSHIAHVYDAGTTDLGQPYLVMELVRGLPITDFCRRQALSIPQRLQLFCDVCHAIHHAHQRGVIHRDLKPSNILVTLHDTVAVAKVIDFGVAKALHEPLTDKTIYTRFAQMIGTPMYMSPEQAEMNAMDVDTRSDIYSLGVVLYELLTDLPPFQQQRFRRASFDEIRRMIREEEPPPPSVRVTTQRRTMAAERITQVNDVPTVDSRSIIHALRGDLDWVVMKAMEKDRRRRYDTAAELGRDIERYLQQQPVIARPPSAWYSFTKFARRNKVAFMTTALVFLSLVVGTITSTLYAIRATHAQAEAERLRVKAEAFASSLKEANILLDNARANVDEERWPQAVAEYTEAARLQPDHYLTWAGRGALYARIGAWHLAAGDYTRALKLGAPANNPAWWGVPQLCTYADRADALQLLSVALKKQLDSSHDPPYLSLLVRGLYLVPHSDRPDRAVTTRLDELLSAPPVTPPPLRGRAGVGFGPPTDAPKNLPPGFPRPLLTYAAALLRYREGNNERVMELMNDLSQTDDFPGAAMAFSVLAMAHAELGQDELARQRLAQSEQLQDRWIRQLGTPQPTEGPAIPWFDGLEAEVLLNEATQKINHAERPHDERLIKFERQAEHLVGSNLSNSP